MFLSNRCTLLLDTFLKRISCESLERKKTRGESIRKETSARKRNRFARICETVDTRARSLRKRRRKDSRRGIQETDENREELKNLEMECCKERRREMHPGVW